MGLRVCPEQVHAEDICHYARHWSRSSHPMAQRCVYKLMYGIFNRQNRFVLTGGFMDKAVY